MLELRKKRLLARSVYDDIDMIVDLIEEFGAPRFEELPSCPHIWAFIPPERSAEIIEECRGFGVLVCRDCGAFETASAADLDDFRLGIIADITVFYPKGDLTGKRMGLL